MKNKKVEGMGLIRGFTVIFFFFSKIVSSYESQHFIFTYAHFLTKLKKNLSNKEIIGINRSPTTPQYPVDKERCLGLR